MISHDLCNPILSSKKTHKLLHPSVNCIPIFFFFLVNCMLFHFCGFNKSLMCLKVGVGQIRNGVSNQPPFYRPLTVIKNMRLEIPFVTANKYAPTPTLLSICFSWARKRKTGKRLAENPFLLSLLFVSRFPKLTFCDFRFLSFL